MPAVPKKFERQVPEVGMRVGLREWIAPETLALSAWTDSGHARVLLSCEEAKELAEALTEWVEGTDAA